jgi:hypothetical protein
MKQIIIILFLMPVTLLAQDKVGIGTDTPQAKLDISAQGNDVRILQLSTERPWVFKQRFTGANTLLSLQPTTNIKKFEILSSDGSNRAVEFFMIDVGSRVSLVPDGGEVGISRNDSTDYGIPRIDSACTYIDTIAADVLGDLFEPDVANIMSYAPAL